jgi:hypothetical protein
VTTGEPISLATVTVATFRPLLHGRFVITAPGRAPIAGTLADIAEHPPARPEWRAPFSLVFHVPRDPKAPPPVQGTVRIEHESLGAFEVFAVPLQPVGDSGRWQVVFG